MADPVDAVIGLDVHNPRAMVAALDKLYSSDAMSGQKATLWAGTFRGSSPSTHTVVVEYDSYADQEKKLKKRNASPDWLRFIQTLDGVSSVKSTRMAIQRSVEGSGWRDHGAMTAFTMAVSDPATYAAAFAEMIDSTGNPGSIRLMEMRFGGEGTTHVVLISAPGSAVLNEYLDELLASDAYRTFAGKVSGIRTIRTVTMLTRVRSFGD